MATTALKKTSGGREIHGGMNNFLRLLVFIGSIEA